MKNGRNLLIFTSYSMLNTTLLGSNSSSKSTWTDLELGSFGSIFKTTGQLEKKASVPVPRRVERLCPLTEKLFRINFFTAPYLQWIAAFCHRHPLLWDWVAFLLGLPSATWLPDFWSLLWWETSPRHATTTMFHSGDGVLRLNVALGSNGKKVLASYKTRQPPPTHTHVRFVSCLPLANSKMASSHEYLSFCHSSIMPSHVLKRGYGCPVNSFKLPSCGSQTPRQPPPLPSSLLIWAKPPWHGNVLEGICTIFFGPVHHS